MCLQDSQKTKREVKIVYTKVKNTSEEAAQKKNQDVVLVQEKHV